MFEIKSSFDSGVKTIFLSGRIDTTNAAEAETILMDEIGKESFDSLTFDMTDLSYISSVGLRLMLKIRKAQATLSLINLTPEVYDIFEMTGFTEMMEVRKAFRQMSVDGCEIIGRGAKGTVYRYNDDTIIKVYKDSNALPAIQNERNLATKAFVLGVPTAISFDIVKVGESYGSVFELLKAKSFSQLIAEDPNNMEKYVQLTSDLLHTIHGVEVKPDELPDFKKNGILDWLTFVKPVLDSDNYAKLEKLVSTIPEDNHMLHCDFHTNNVVMQNGETMVIDMDTLSHGHPVMELANTKIAYVDFGLIDPSVVEKFMSMPYEMSVKFWNRLFEVYLGEENKDKIDEIRDKVDVLVCARLIRHATRHWGTDSELGSKVIGDTVERLKHLLAKVDTLIY